MFRSHRFQKWPSSLIVNECTLVQIEATYVTENGEKKKSLLLVSGWYVESFSRLITFYVPAHLAASFQFMKIFALFSRTWPGGREWEFYRWAMARHFHYAPEISAAFFWTVPALFSHVSISMLGLLVLVCYALEAIFDQRATASSRCRVTGVYSWDLIPKYPI